MTGFELKAYEELRYAGATEVEALRRARLLQVMQWDRGGERPQPSGWIYMLTPAEKAERPQKPRQESLHGPVKHLSAAQYLRARVAELGAQIAVSG